MSRTVNYSWSAPRAADKLKSFSFPKRLPAGSGNITDSKTLPRKKEFFPSATPVHGRLSSRPPERSGDYSDGHRVAPDKGQLGQIIGCSASQIRLFYSQARQNNIVNSEQIILRREPVLTAKGLFYDMIINFQVTAHCSCLMPYRKPDQLINHFFNCLKNV